MCIISGFESIVAIEDREMSSGEKRVTDNNGAPQSWCPGYDSDCSPTHSCCPTPLASAESACGPSAVLGNAFLHFEDLKVFFNYAIQITTNHHPRAEWERQRHPARAGSTHHCNVEKALRGRTVLLPLIMFAGRRGPRATMSTLNTGSTAASSSPNKSKCPSGLLPGAAPVSFTLRHRKLNRQFIECQPIGRSLLRLAVKPTLTWPELGRYHSHELECRAHPTAIQR